MKKIDLFKSISLIILMIYGLTANSQKWQFGIQLYPNISDGIPKKDALDANYFQGISKTSIFSYSGGLKLNYTFNKKWSIVSGVLFQKTGDRSKNMPADFNRGILFARYYRAMLYNIEIPVNVEYTTKSNWFVGSGVSLMANIYNRTVAFNINGEGVEDDVIGFDLVDLPVSTFNCSANIELGRKFKFGRKIFSAALYSQFYLRQGFKDYSVGSWFLLPGRTNMALGLNLGFIF